jgi:hypothetical protein
MNGKIAENAMRNLFRLSLFPLLVPGLAFATIAQVSPLRPDSLSLPKGKPAWVVRVTRSGGLTGEHVLDVTVSSSGSLKCVSNLEGNCGTSVSDDTLQDLSQLALHKMPESRSRISAACGHCPVTRITLQQRDSNGKEHKYFAYWSDASAGGISRELVQLARAVLALSR